MIDDNFAYMSPRSQQRRNVYHSYLAMAAAHCSDRPTTTFTLPHPNTQRTASSLLSPSKAKRKDILDSNKMLDKIQQKQQETAERRLQKLSEIKNKMHQHNEVRTRQVEDTYVTTKLSHSPPPSSHHLDEFLTKKNKSLQHNLAHSYALHRVNTVQQRRNKILQNLAEDRDAARWESLAMEEARILAERNKARDILLQAAREERRAEKIRERGNRVVETRSNTSMAQTVKMQEEAQQRREQHQSNKYETIRQQSEKERMLQTKCREAREVYANEMTTVLTESERRWHDKVQDIAAIRKEKLELRKQIANDKDKMMQQHVERIRSEEDKYTRFAVDAYNIRVQHMEEDAHRKKEALEIKLRKSAKEAEKKVHINRERLLKEQEEREEMLRKRESHRAQCEAHREESLASRKLKAREMTKPLACTE
eukprot:PhF_6_TR21723/c0_g1_i2/m.31041